jgi:hypothetical protein
MKCAKSENEWIEENKYLIVLLGKVLMDRPLMMPYRESKEKKFSLKDRFSRNFILKYNIKLHLQPTTSTNYQHKKGNKNNLFNLIVQL